VNGDPKGSFLLSLVVTLSAIYPGLSRKRGSINNQNFQNICMPVIKLIGVPTPIMVSKSDCTHTGQFSPMLVLPMKAQFHRFSFAKAESQENALVSVL
jgi:hypothetical protein